MSVAAVADQEYRLFRAHENSIITQQTRALTLQNFTCDICHRDSRRLDTWPIVNIDIDKRNKHQSLEDALDDSFYRSEQIPGYDCDHCKRPAKDRGNAHRTVTFLHLPDYMIISLNRTGVDARSQSTFKVETLVRFPEKLDMSKYYCSDSKHPAESAAARSRVELRYECYAVIQHSGTLKGGHWWTIAKSPKTAQWRELNDKSVTKSSWAETQKNTTTIIFYKRIGAK